MATTAHDFSELCNSVRAAHASLRGCTSSEKANEAAILRRVMAELEKATLKRPNIFLEQRRHDLLDHCRRTLGDQAGDPAAVRVF